MKHGSPLGIVTISMDGVRLAVVVVLQAPSALVVTQPFPVAELGASGVVALLLPPHAYIARRIANNDGNTKYCMTIRVRCADCIDYGLRRPEV